jgi:probable HAF family extracellular repeat protein
MHPSTPRRLAFATLVFAAATVAQAATYHLVDLGLHNEPTQVNKQGDMSGVTYGPHALVYRGDHWKRLRAERERTSQALAINAGGDVAGYVVTNHKHPVIWPRGGERIVLSGPEGAWSGVATAISDARVVVGYYSGSDVNLDCLRWSAGEGVVDLGMMADGDFCRAWAINRSGVIVGQASVESGGAGLAFRYENGEFRNLGTLPGGAWSWALAINNQGHIVGWSSPDPAPDHAFLWSGGAMKDIGASSDFENTVAKSINDHGDIVGDGFSPADQRFHALHFFPDGPPIALETEVDDLADWQLQYANSVSEAGVIVGIGRRSSGDGWHGFALVPVEGR